MALTALKNNAYDFSFIERSIMIDELINVDVLTSTASPLSDEWIYVYTNHADIRKINIVSGVCEKVISFKFQRFPTNALFHLYISADEDYLAVTCLFQGDYKTKSCCEGAIINLQSGFEVLKLNAGDYHMQENPFPVCFIKHQGKTAVMHATDWNRLDITDLETGLIITERDIEKMPEENNDSVFSEWAGVLKPSPNQERVATIGWVWHPFGCAYSFNLKRWLAGEKWEADSSIHRRSYAGWDGFWDSSFLWIDDKRLCIWGVPSKDDYSLSESNVAIFDAETEDELLRFSGPTKDVLFYDEFLFSGIEKEGNNNLGVSIWNIENGDLLHQEFGLKVDLYLTLSKELVKFEGQGKISLTKWQTY